MGLDHLIGRDVLDVILEIPKIEWQINSWSGLSMPRPARISKLVFVDYQQEKPRTRADNYTWLDVRVGLTKDNLSFVEAKQDRMVGLTSRVKLGGSYERVSYAYAQIPMIDFDTHDNFKDMPEKELLSLIKTKIREDLRINQGVLLRSGPKRNFHFMGLGDLLSDSREFTSFVGLCLLMEHKTADGRELPLVDARYMGHALVPLKYMSELDETGKTTPYESDKRFATLRLTPKPGYQNIPRVVDVLD